jgi:hypothetical protein
MKQYDRSLPWRRPESIPLSARLLAHGSQPAFADHSVAAEQVLMKHLVPDTEGSGAQALWHQTRSNTNVRMRSSVNIQTTESL